MIQGVEFSDRFKVGSGTVLGLVLTRHGQSYGNLDRSLGPDTGLTDLGREQAARLGAWLDGQGYRFSALYCSPLRRARQTAEIVNDHLGLEVVLDAGLRETEVPYLERLPERAEPLGVEAPPPFSAEYEQMRARVARATARILAENLAGQVLVVAHGGTLGTMVRTILGTHALLVRTDQAAVHVLSWLGGRWNLQYVNRQEHLVGLG
jgi:broad specificity phosphatase PhoE